jgi:hypothetical protein
VASGVAVNNEGLLDPDPDPDPDYYQLFDLADVLSDDLWASIPDLPPISSSPSSQSPIELYPDHEEQSPPSRQHKQFIDKLHLAATRLGCRLFIHATDADDIKPKIVEATRVPLPPQVTNVDGPSHSNTAATRAECLAISETVDSSICYLPKPAPCQIFFDPFGDEIGITNHASVAIHLAPFETCVPLDTDEPREHIIINRFRQRTLAPGAWAFSLPGKSVAFHFFVQPRNVSVLLLSRSPKGLAGSKRKEGEMRGPTVSEPSIAEQQRAVVRPLTPLSDMFTQGRTWEKESKVYHKLNSVSPRDTRFRTSLCISALLTLSRTTSSSFLEGMLALVPCS